MMRDHEMERYIRTAVEHAAPDKLDSILSSCDEIKSTSTTPISSQAEGGQRKGAVIKMSEKKSFWNHVELPSKADGIRLNCTLCLDFLRKQMKMYWR